MIDVRFPTALQVMLSLALAQREGVARVSSAVLAAGVGSNPTLIRRQIAPLVSRDLVTTTMGRDGGLALARPANEISLADVYGAVMDGRTPWAARSDIPHQCLVSSNVEAYFAGLANLMDEAVLSRLRLCTLQGALDDLAKVSGRRQSAGNAGRR